MKLLVEWCGLLFTLLNPILLQAQTAPEFSRGPHIVSLGERAEGACLSALQTLQGELSTLRFPDDWTIAVTCNSVTWDRALKRAGNPATHTAFTGLSTKWTVINSEVFRELAPVVRHTIAHELGHIRCHCDDEGRAEVEARAALKSRTILAEKGSATHMAQMTADVGHRW